jgi:hypothetical protein
MLPNIVYSVVAAFPWSSVRPNQRVIASEAKQSRTQILKVWIASSLALLAMTIIQFETTLMRRARFQNGMQPL